MSLNTELSDLFRTFAALMEIKGENAFKAISFSKVSRVLKDATIDLKKAVEENTLEDLDGVGPPIGIKRMRFKAKRLQFADDGAKARGDFRFAIMKKTSCDKGKSSESRCIGGFMWCERRGE